jgi:hypothetical protein
MFSDEVAVSYPAVEKDWQMSAFVPSSFVRPESEHYGEVKVEVFESNGAPFAILPSAPDETVHIARDDLRQP